MARFLHLHTFYPEAINQLYKRFPDLGSTSFNFQCKTVLEDAFSAVHIFTPYLEKMGYETQFIVANNPHAQSKWLQENSTALLNRNNWIQDIAARQIEAFKPDILYSCNPSLFDSKFLRGLSHKPLLTMAWRGADIDDSMDLSAYDLLLSGLPLLLEKAKELGVKDTAFFFPGFPVEIAQQTADIEPIRDVVFSGSWTNKQHLSRNAYLRHIAREADNDMRGYSCALHLAGDLKNLPLEISKHLYPPVFGLSMHSALKKGRITFDARANHRYQKNGQVFDIGGEDTINMRLFEATGTGCFLLTEHMEGLKRYFEPGSEIETFRNNDELIEKIRYYLDHPEERNAIAERGQQRCLQEYPMEKRVIEFDRIIHSALIKKAAKGAYMDAGQPAQITEAPSAEPQASSLEHQQINSAIDANTPQKTQNLMHSSDDQSTSMETRLEETEITRKQQAETLLRSAIDTFKAGDFSGSFKSATQAKALRIPVANVDYLRAACLLHLGKPFDAREALREELHYFPGNSSAQQLLDEVMKSAPYQHKTNDPEFLEILQQIRPHTMVPEARLYSLFTLAKYICVNDLPGNFVECGVARGGSTAMLGIIIDRYSKRERHHFGFDSFEGMPEPTVYDTQRGVYADDTGWGTGTCAGDIAAVQRVCDQFQVGSKVTLVKGYFEDTLSNWKDQIGDIALLHLDADWYSSTMTILNEFYDMVLPGGFMQYDDYGCWDGCKKAVEEFQQFHNLSFELQSIPGDGQGVWMQKNA